MIPTSQELRQERDRFTRLIQAALGPLVRIRLDPEGWPAVPAQHGRIEWRGVAPDGSERLYAFTDRPRLIRPLLAVAGVRRVQIGDTEAVVSLAGDDGPAIQAVAALLRTKTRRPPDAPRPAGFSAASPRPEAVPGARSAPDDAGKGPVAPAPRAAPPSGPKSLSSPPAG